MDLVVILYTLFVYIAHQLVAVMRYLTSSGLAVMLFCTYSSFGTRTHWNHGLE